MIGGMRFEPGDVPFQSRDDVHGDLGRPERRLSGLEKVEVISSLPFRPWRLNCLSLE